MKKICHTGGNANPYSVQFQPMSAQDTLPDEDALISSKPTQISKPKLLIGEAAFLW